jgi:hypothetical protein
MDGCRRDTGEVSTFLLPLPVSRIPGVGKVTEARLKEVGVETSAALVWRRCKASSVGMAVVSMNWRTAPLSRRSSAPVGESQKSVPPECQASGSSCGRTEVEVSPELISTVTDGVMEEVRAWQGRPLEKTYVIL